MKKFKIIPIPNSNSNIKLCDELETIKMLQNGYSITRFGDGEHSIFNSKNYLKHKSQTIFYFRLKEYYQKILDEQLDNNKLLLGFNVMHTPPRYKKLWYKYCNNNLKKNKDKIFNNPWIFRLSDVNMVCNNDKVSLAKEILKIWKDKNILLVCNEQTKKKILKVINCVNIKNCSFIYIPSISAFSKFDEILTATKNKLKENKFDIIIISGGQMANAFVYEMHKIIQVIDIGSIEFGTNIYLEAKKDLLN